MGHKPTELVLLLLSMNHRTVCAFVSEMEGLTGFFTIKHLDACCCQGIVSIYTGNAEWHDGSKWVVCEVVTCFNLKNEK